MHKYLISLSLTVGLMVGIAPSATAATPNPTLGFYVDGCNPANNVKVGKTLGVTPGTYSAYTDGSSWSSIGGDNYCDSKYGHHQELILSVAMCVSTSSGENLAALPKNIGEYTTLAKDVVAAGYTDTIYRIGWESNGNYGGGGYCWTQSGYKAYVSGWHLIHDAILAADPSAQFDWNLNAGGPDGQVGQDGKSWTKWYPGSAYVTTVSEDFYCNGSPIYTTDIELGPIDLASTEGKPWAITEWGQDSDCGDNVSFMSQTDDLILGKTFTNPDGGGTVAEPAAAYQSYFWADNCELTNFPKSEKAYEKAFG